MGNESSRRNHGGGILEKKKESLMRIDIMRRINAGRLMEEESWRPQGPSSRQLGGSWQPEGIQENTQGAPRRHPGCIQEAPTGHSGSTEENPGGTLRPPGGPRRHPEVARRPQEASCVLEVERAIIPARTQPGGERYQGSYP